jgi:hypothetical protein
MMKSIFLSDSKLLDSNQTPTTFNNSSSGQDNDEFIMVDSCDYDADSNPDTEEEEYDYCDDAISEGVQGYTCSFAFSLTEDMILEEAEQPSIQHILDEAHKSASQLVSVVSDQHQPDQDQDPQLNQMPGILESSASDVSVQSSPPPERKKPEAKPPAPAQPQGMLGGRMSNKKRRKKMKLLKKAAAAASAAAALSSDVPRSASMTSSSSKSAKKHTKVAPATRYQSKRVANVAVACATETLASYKAELKSTSQKMH